MITIELLQQAVTVYLIEMACFFVFVFFLVVVVMVGFGGFLVGWLV